MPSNSLERYHYSIFDIVIDSDITLPELDKSDERSPLLKIFNGYLPDKQSIDWHHEWKDNDVIQIHFGRIGEKYVINFPGLSSFCISLKDFTIQYHVDTAVPPESIRHLLLDQVIPRTLGQLGHYILHASAVKLKNGNGVAFLGQSGWGKSTLASSFRESGAALISDDCLLIENNDISVIGTTSYPGVRLLDDSTNAIFPGYTKTFPVAHYSTKRRIKINPEVLNNIPTSVSLDALFLLSDPDLTETDDLVAIEPVRGAEELMSLIKQTFVLDPLDKALIAKLFKTTGSFLETGLPVYRIHYPHSYDRLKDTKDAIYNLVSANKSNHLITC